MKAKKCSPLAIFPVGNHFVLLHLFVQLTLERTHPDLDDLLHLVRQFTLYILLQTSQQERSQNLMQTTDDEQCFFFVQFNLIRSARVGKGSVEPFVKRFDRVEDFGESKVEQGPEFREVVLPKG